MPRGPLSLLSVYVDPVVLQPWRASVKALNITQGVALEEALKDWLAKKRAEIDQAMEVRR